jgi:hypothetical protein
MKPNMITEEELQLVKLAIMLPIVMDTLEYDLNKFKAAGLKLPTVHTANLKKQQNYIMQDMKVVKRELIQRGIKIFEEGKVPDGYKAKYLCRGYRHELVISSNIIKSLVIIKLSELMEIPIDQIGG